MRSVGGIVMCRAPDRYSLFKLSLPLMKGRTVGERHVPAGLGSPDQRAEHFRTIGVSPAEVVQKGDSLGIGANGNDVSHRFIHGCRRHSVRVQISIAGIDPAANRQGGAVTQHRHDDGSIPRPVVMVPHQRLDRRAAADLVVVLPDNPFLAADVVSSQDFEEVFREVRRGRSRTCGGARAWG